VTIEAPQRSKHIAGVVNDPSGAALPGVTVEERSDDWKIVLRSTETDELGKFHFERTGNKKIYHLEFSRSGFNWLRITLELDKRGTRSISVRMPIGT
jgi:hypothetical protein